MKIKELLTIVGDEAVFRAGFLAASGESLPSLRLQLSRWAKAGKIVQLVKGLYTLAEPYRKASPHPFVLANAIKKASYVSLQSALAHFGMIPEYVPTVTSVTTRRPQRVVNPTGTYQFHHVKTEWFCRYETLEFGRHQKAFVATPEKALMDLAYLTPGADNPCFLRELRLQNLEILDDVKLSQLAAMSGSPKLCRVAEIIAQFRADELGESR